MDKAHRNSMTRGNLVANEPILFNGKYMKGMRKVHEEKQERNREGKRLEKFPRNEVKKVPPVQCILMASEIVEFNDVYIYSDDEADCEIIPDLQELRDLMQRKDNRKVLRSIPPVALKDCVHSNDEGCNRGVLEGHVKTMSQNIEHKVQKEKNRLIKVGSIREMKITTKECSQEHSKFLT